MAVFWVKEGNYSKKENKVSIIAINLDFFLLFYFDFNFFNISMLGSNPSTILIMLVLMIIGVIITQVMSNIALSAILIPLSVTLATAQGQPIGVYAVPVAIACSLSFMLPMADPTVAMAYVQDM